MKPANVADSEQKVLVYDFNASGHCPSWMYLAAMGFRQAGAEVTVACLADRPEVRPWADRLASAGCRVAAIPGNGIFHAKHAADLARGEGILKVFFPNFDSVIYEIGKYDSTGSLDGLDIGGIWLRPELKPHPCGPLRRAIEKIIRTRANKLRRKHARAVNNNRRGLADFLPGSRRVAAVRLFFTSDTAVTDIKAMLLSGEAHCLCDPWLTRTETPRQEARTGLGLDGSRVILLHLGTSRPEKGLKDVCEAMLQLEYGILNRLLLLRAGKVDRSDAPSLRRLEQAGAAHVMDRYLAEEEMAACYAACDWVLLPYRNQTETSGVLIHAAAHDRPVIVSDHGWIGQSTRMHELGWLFPHGDVKALAGLLAMASTGNSDGWNPAGSRRFAADNSPQRFQRMLVQHWLNACTDPAAASG